MMLLRLCLLYSVVLVTPASSTLHFPVYRRQIQPVVKNVKNQNDNNNNNNQDNDQRQLAKALLIDDEDFDEIYRGYGIHYITIYVGCPPQPQTLIVDTGSSRIGFPCSDCDSEVCGAEYHLNPFYNEANSSCFSVAPCYGCGIGTCNEDPFSDSSCQVEVAYAEGSSWKGIEVSDLVSIGSDDEDSYYMRFACQTSVSGLFQTQLADGILGMNSGDFSGWRQLYNAGAMSREQFSICTASWQSIQDTTAPAGVLILGDTNILESDGIATNNYNNNDNASVVVNTTTPTVYARRILSFDNQFTVVINGFTFRVGCGYSAMEENNNINDNTDEVISMGCNNENPAVKRFEVPVQLRTHKAFVDSGTTFTYLPRALKNAFLEGWSSVSDLEFGKDVGTDNLETLPTILIHLLGRYSGDITIAFPPTRYLYQKGRNTYGFTIDFINGKGVLGANLMSGHNVIFDLEENRIGFEESECGIMPQPPRFDSDDDDDDDKDDNQGPASSGNKFICLYYYIIFAILLLLLVGM